MNKVRIEIDTLTKRLVKILDDFTGEQEETFECIRCGHKLPSAHFEYKDMRYGSYGNSWCMACNHLYNSTYNKFGVEECQRQQRAYDRAKVKVLKNKKVKNN